MAVKAVTKRGKPHWLVDVGSRTDGTRRRRFLDRKRYMKRDAVAVEREMLAELAKGARNKPDTKIETVTADAVMPIVQATRQREIPTFGEFARQWLELQDPERPSFKNKRRRIQLHLTPFFGDMKLNAITTLHVDRFRAHFRQGTGVTASSRRTKNRKKTPHTRRRKGGRRSPKTINNVLSTFRSVMNRALEYDLIDRVPIVRFEREPKRDPEFLDFDEALVIVDTVAVEWRVLVLFAIRTGLRRGELMELRWSDFYFEVARPYVRVQRALEQLENGSWRPKDPKSNRPRSVPLSPDLISALLEQRGDKRGSELVFPGTRGGYFDDRALYRALVAAAKHAGVEKHVHPHMLRHTFASHCTMLGIPPAKIQKWMGHASLSTTERYAHLRPDFGDDLIVGLADPRGALRDRWHHGGTTVAPNLSRDRKTPSRGS